MDVQYDILVNTLGPIGPTRLMSASSLNHRMLTKHLRRLLAIGYVVYASDSKVYSITVEGRTFVRNYEEYQKALLAAQKAFSVLRARTGLGLTFSCKQVPRSIQVLAAFP